MDDGAKRRQRFAAVARGGRPDLALLCLLLAAEADPALDDPAIDAALRELDRLASLVSRHQPHSPGDWADVLAEELGGRCGFHGMPADYERLESSLLHRVLERRRGLPILLSVVWIEVGRRLGAPIHGVALPGHFVVGIGEPAGGQVLADPFRGGRVLSADEAAVLVAGATGAALSPGMLGPADPLDVIARVLNNIRAWAAARPEHSDVQLWAVELALLLPRHPARLRLERARLLVERGDFVTGAREMESYAQVVDAMDSAAAETIRRQARAARAMLN